MLLVLFIFFLIRTTQTQSESYIIHFFLTVKNQGNFRHFWISDIGVIQTTRKRSTSTHTHTHTPDLRLISRDIAAVKMLKWAVNQPRPSYLAKELPGGAATNPMASAAAAATGAGCAAGSGSGASSYSEFHALRGKLKRKSLCLALAHGQGKENQLTSTPLPASSLSMQPRTPLLKDLSNIMSSPLTTPTPTLRPPAAAAAAAPSAYASTLPTFEAEYSPSAAIIPGPLLALRGMGIPDSYFEKPRYLEQKPLPLPLPLPQASAMKSGQTTLSSTQMGDVTLERMIDAILESTRKAPAPRQQRQRQRLRQRHRHHPLSSTTSADAATHSPTYRPAFDPASDLCEYWKSPHASGYEEREVRSPQPAAELPATVESQSQGKRRSLQLRRQRVVRRKRKIATRISSSVRQSAQKLLAAARSGQKIRHISPDSGHNSTSDCDFEEEVDSLSSLGACGGLGLGLGLGLDAATKRRLSFSFQEDLFVEK
ncbi:uncharacterized protein LOC111072782 [Drosophila obscura]|uniref:uncharacterized protein LOC111072782 n=1 Tax=Drosophila obscura TaxID=7282 RepID=UPI001BB24829|nr:uncharacterized protein LOC111072782 [Drosophila obscura]